MQPCQPVLAGHDEHVAGAAIDHSSGGGQRALLAQRVTVVPDGTRIRATVGYQRRGRRARTGFVIIMSIARGCCVCSAAAQAAHWPKTVKCERSSRKPRSSASR